MQCEIVGISDLTRIIYLHTTIEGELCFYQVLAWTLPSRKSAAMDVFREVVHSFQDLAPRQEHNEEMPQVLLEINHNHFEERM